MRYVIATYNKLRGSHESTPFGVILNNGVRTYYYFDGSVAKQRLLKEGNSAFDKPTFANFEQTFVEMFITPGKAITTDEKGKRHEIDVNAEGFLEHLTKTYEGPYQYSEPLSTEGDDPEEVLTRLKQLISA